VVTNVIAVDELLKVSDASVAIATSESGAANSAPQVSAAAANKAIIIRSRDDNSNVNPLWVGGSTVDAANSANGYPLDAGESLELPIENANMLYVDSVSANQKYTVIAV